MHILCEICMDFHTELLNRNTETNAEMGPTEYEIGLWGRETEIDKLSHPYSEVSGSTGHITK